MTELSLFAIITFFFSHEKYPKTNKMTEVLKLFRQKNKMSQRKEKLSVDRSVKAQHTWVGLPRVGHPVFGRLCPSLIPVMAVARLLTLGQLRCQVVARVVS